MSSFQPVGDFNVEVGEEVAIAVELHGYGAVADRAWITFGCAQSEIRFHRDGIVPRSTESEYWGRVSFRRALKRIRTEDLDYGHVRDATEAGSSGGCRPLVRSAGLFHEFLRLAFAPAQD
jgi:hypothetical protein